MWSGAIEYSCEIVINRPPAHVFVLLTDLERYLARWAKGPVAAKKLTSGATTTGAHFEVTARVAGLRVRAPYAVTSFERDQRFAGQGTAGPVRFGEEYTLLPDREASDRTRLRYSNAREPACLPTSGRPGSTRPRTRACWPSPPLCGVWTNR